LNAATVQQYKMVFYSKVLLIFKLSVDALPSAALCVKEQLWQLAFENTKIRCFVSFMI
jgi:hypothetical protein